MTKQRYERYAALDKRYVWHPFTQMSEWVADDPLIIERGEGNYLIDTEGARYLDGVASLWVNVHGHNCPEINQAMVEQISRISHSTLLGLGNVPAIELAERLSELAPVQNSRVFYSDSGSTAVEIALKQAFQFWSHSGRPAKRRFVHLADAYHGDTLGAVAVGGIPLFHEAFGPMLPHGSSASLSVPTPHRYRWPERSSTPADIRDACLRALRELFDAKAGEIAGLIIEPLVQGAAGMLLQPSGYLRGVADLCAEFEVLLIADEVATGFGRTGTMFACEQEGVRPDLLCLAKGLTGGYLPLAATLSSERIYRAFLAPRTEYKTFFHGHTYTGNPVACAAAFASLALFEQRDRVREGAARGRVLGQLLDEHVAGLAAVGDIRQRGLMVGIELVASRETREPFPPARGIGNAVCRAMRRDGVILRPLGDVVVVMPPLTITDAELEHIVIALRRAIERCT